MNRFLDNELQNLVSKIYVHWPEGLVVQKINFEPCSLGMVIQFRTTLLVSV